jgi:hypothetical protein
LAKFSPLLLLLLGIVITAAPWHLLMLAKYGRNFFDSYFIYHVFKRGTEAIEGKTAPLLWYLTVIKVGFRIWAIPLLAGIPYTVYKVYKSYNSYRGTKTERVGLFLLLWAGVIFAFFSWAKSKLIWYIIPIYPALALLNAYFFLGVLEFFHHKVRDIRVFGVIRGLGVLGVLFAGVFYVYLERARVWPKDFTKEEVALIELRNTMDPRKNIMLLLPGIASPVPRYYNDGPVREISAEELADILKGGERTHALVSFADYTALKPTLAAEGIELRLIGSYPSEGDLVLIERVTR